MCTCKLNYSDSIPNRSTNLTQQHILSVPMNHLIHCCCYGHHRRLAQGKLTHNQINTLDTPPAPSCVILGPIPCPPFLSRNPPNRLRRHLRHPCPQTLPKSLRQQHRSQHPLSPSQQPRLRFLPRYLHPRARHCLQQELQTRSLRRYLLGCLWFLQLVRLVMLLEQPPRPRVLHPLRPLLLCGFRLV